MAERRTKKLTYDDLNGWPDDDHAEALRVYCVTSRVDEADVQDARAFFESRFQPYLIEDGNPAKFTGYYEPELDGAMEKSDRFAYPVYAMPDDAQELSRRDITNGALDGRGLEIVWLADPVDLFFLQIQGSGRIRLPDGTGLRVGFAGKNDRPYRSVGKEMIGQGILSPGSSAEDMKDWLKAHPKQGAKLMQHNQSYVFFKAMDHLSPELGPVGTMGKPVTALRSIAVDPEYVPLGAPVWLALDAPCHMKSLTIAQDTGSAIKGAQRADLFFGTGTDAGNKAGALNQGGQMIVLRESGQSE